MKAFYKNELSQMSSWMMRMGIRKGKKYPKQLIPIHYQKIISSPLKPERDRDRKGPNLDLCSTHFYSPIRNSNSNTPAMRQTNNLLSLLTI